MSDKNEPGNEKGAAPHETGAAPVPPSKTPLFVAKHAARYQRQELVKQINRQEGTHLLCYVSGKDAEIDRDDILGFVEMLHNVPDDSPVDLLLHTYGGDVDACEKLFWYVRAKTGGQAFRVIVPDLAKSAGTLLALGADKIIMSDSSELGMIDPQFLMKDAQGSEFWISVTDYLNAFDEQSDLLRNNPSDPVTLLMLDRFDPKIIKKFQAIRDRVRTFAEDILKRRGAEATLISGEFMSSYRWKTHGRPIGHADAIQIGLPVEYLPSSNERWALYWSLYCLQRLEVGDKLKIYESSFVSQLTEETR